MKRFTFLVIFLASIFAGNAQKLKVSNNQLLMLEKSGKAVNTKKKQNDYVGFDGTSHYFIVDRTTLLKVDESLKKINSYTLSRSFEGRSLINFYSEGVAGLICIDGDKNEYTVKRVTVAGNGLNENVLQTIQCDKNDYYSANVSVSADKQLKMVAISIISSKNIYKYTTIFVFNNQGEIIWSEKISPGFKNDTFVFYDMTVSNDGSVYVLANSYVVGVKNCDVHLFKVNDGEGISEKTTIPFGFNTIGAMKIIELPNGNLFAGGYYTHSGIYSYSNSVKDLGTFSYVFDSQNLEKLNFQSKTLEQTVPKGVSVKDAYSDGKAKNLKGIYLTSDGKITMLAEEHVVMSGRDIPTTYIYNNVLIHSFSLDGNYENSSVLFKKQTTHTVDAMASFEVLVNGDELILLYNDNAKNDITKNLPKPKGYIAFFYKKGQTVACTVKNGLVGKKQSLVNAKAENRIIYNVEEQFDKEAIVRVQTGTAFMGPLMLEKISW